MAESFTASENAFIERLGFMAEADGLTRITGRIWGLLVVSGKAMAPAQIAGALKISRASVSLNMKALETFDLVELQTRPGDRQKYYAMRARPYAAMIEALARRTAASSAMVRGALKCIERPEARRRLKDLCKFYEIMEAGYHAMRKDMDALR